VTNHCARSSATSEAITSSLASKHIDELGFERPTKRFRIHLADGGDVVGVPTVEAAFRQSAIVNKSPVTNHESPTIHESQITNRYVPEVYCSTTKPFDRAA
jgi:hypothetical protein